MICKECEKITMRRRCETLCDDCYDKEEEE